MDRSHVERQFGRPPGGDGLVTSAEALRIALARFGRSGRGAWMEEGVLLTCGPPRSSGPYAHAVFRLARACPAERVLTIARQHASGCATPVGLWTSEHEDADVEAAARATGYRRFSDPPLAGMVADAPSTPSPERGDVTVTPAEDPRVLAAVVAAAFQQRGISLAAATALVGNPTLLSAQGVHAFLSVVDGRPVASALAFVEPPYGVLTYVGTVPSARGRGAATEATLAAIRAAVEGGAERLGLQATQEARNLYRGLGFADVTEYPCYRVPPSSAGTSPRMRTLRSRR